MKKIMHKVAYIAGGIIIGVVFSTSAGAFADTVKGMVGKKVTGEYTVVVDGKKLSDKGSVIDGRANVPVRAYSDALGADIKIDGRTIMVTSVKTEDSVNNQSAPGTTKASQEVEQLKIRQTYLESYAGELESQIKVLEQEKAASEKQLATANPGMETQVYQQAVDIVDKKIAEKRTELEKTQSESKQVNEALTTAK